MQNINAIKNNKLNFGILSLFMCLTLVFSSCEFEFELPEAGSIPDETPPSAAFDFSQSEDDFLTYNFTNLSASATDYAWDFGDGNSSTDKDPSNSYAAEGSYTVTLTVSDKLGVSSVTAKMVTVEEVIIEFVPVILEPGFEDLSLPDGSGDGRDSWRNDAGGVIQITSSPVASGDQAAKLPSDGDRVGQQLIAVLPNTDYVLGFQYTMKTDPGVLTVAILSNVIDDLAGLGDAMIASVELTDNSDANTYVQTSLAFNSGDNTEVAIFFGNSGSECRIDDFTIE